MKGDRIVPKVQGLPSGIKWLMLQQAQRRVSHEAWMLAPHLAGRIWKSLLVLIKGGRGKP